MPLTNADKSIRFFSIIMAWQQFAGKPMKCTDAAKVLSEQEIEQIEAALRKLAVAYKKEDAVEFPELVKLGEHIERRLS